MATSQNATVTVNLTSNGSFADTIGLGCASLPAGVFCHFSSPSVKLTADGSASVQLTIDTNNPLSGGSSAMNTARTPSRRLEVLTRRPVSALEPLLRIRILAPAPSQRHVLVHGNAPAAFSGRPPGHRMQQLLDEHRRARHLHDSGNRHRRKHQRGAVPERFAHHHEIDPRRRSPSGHGSAKRARENDEFIA